jgi:iron(II)-dependent oxidoreductase
MRKTTPKLTAPSKRFWLLTAGTGALAAAGVIAMSRGLGFWSGLPALIGLALLLGAWRTGKRPAKQTHQPLPPPVPVKRKRPAPPRDTDALVEMLLTQNRYALLLRPEIKSNLTGEQLKAAIDALSVEMAGVSPGPVSLLSYDDAHCGSEGQGDVESAEEVLFVDAFFIDRTCVTNHQFQQFVDCGGYEDDTLWRPEIWHAVPNFLDSTGLPGPRYWADGTYPAGEGDLPVVGVSWFEADAYARWAGKALPTDGQWQKAGSCPVVVGPGTIVQRCYPWGDSMDKSRANVWGSGPGRPAPVTEYRQGATGDGVLQLIGNVWEWTTDDFIARPRPRNALILPSPMKSIRGGAFDTYFDNQASCLFQSGDNPLSRKHNIGFRCALPAFELNPADEQPEAAPTGAEADQATLCAEVAT